MILARIVGASSALAVILKSAGYVLAQSATDAAKGGTDSSLPDAGTTEITYFIFLGGALLFAFGTLKLVLSFRD